MVTHNSFFIYAVERRRNLCSMAMKNELVARQMSRCEGLQRHQQLTKNNSLRRCYCDTLDFSAQSKCPISLKFKIIYPEILVRYLSVSSFLQRYNIRVRTSRNWFKFGTTQRDGNQIPQRLSSRKRASGRPFFFGAFSTTFLQERNQTLPKSRRFVPLYVLVPCFCTRLDVSKSQVAGRRLPAPLHQ